MAILAEEETASVMDSPAYASEEMGVTKLDQTCGHAFCRKELRCIPILFCIAADALLDVLSTILASRIGSLAE